MIVRHTVLAVLLVTLVPHALWPVAVNMLWHFKHTLPPKKKKLTINKQALLNFSIVCLFLYLHFPRFLSLQIKNLNSIQFMTVCKKYIKIGNNSTGQWMGFPCVYSVLFQYTLSYFMYSKPRSVTVWSQSYKSHCHTSFFFQSYIFDNIMWFFTGYNNLPSCKTSN